MRPLTAEIGKALLGIFLSSAALACAAAPETGMIELEIPPAVAKRASETAAGAVGVAPPVIVVEDLTVDPKAGLSLEVRGPEGADGVRPVIALTGVVGNPSDPVGTPRQQMTLVIPLNRKGQELIAAARAAGRDKLQLRLVGEGGEALIYRRVYFQDEAAATEPPPP